ncbi:hypothetical protein Asppvi_009959 [Aspergillus pseudoviridinutans]|uniref:Major facilitator superfamily (MFS) profile domain-containing protein n=1 Tax=Aspergillus pseudoviridinutans TaxID=1517512 RepID=A0A9P3BIL3_9EURO|nr:uncharacterized protein Asppvi_009959 [Aspergillus pseudoviridinutans]GIJ90994.1 hypothetical protein Asppvi_009959 [Aspergillus pseudoviridinutans]
METIRDSAFGKLVRFFSGYRLFLYPEEIDDSAWRKYLERPEAYRVESMATGSEEFYEQNALYTVMSQASRRGRERPPLKSVLAGPWRGIGDGTPEVIGWSDASDSENPQNWSVRKKIFVTLLICLLTFSIYIGSAIYTPGIPGVAKQFGFAVIYAKNIGMLLAFRFITGFMGSPVLATGGASIGDMWDPRTRDYMIAVWASFAIAAPVLGPLVGGFAAPVKGWTWTIWELLWVSGFALVFLFFFLPETFAPNILSRRARRIRRITGDQRYASEPEIEIARVAPRVRLHGKAFASM